MNIRSGYILDRNTLLKGYRARQALSKFHALPCVTKWRAVRLFRQVFHLRVIMNAEMVTRIIQTIIAPVVMVNACAILLGGLLNHSAAINDRLRGMTRERIEMLRAAGAPTADRLLAERLDEIDTQMPDLLYRLGLIRSAIMSVYGAILLLVVDMLVIALAVVSVTDWLTTAILVVFLAGIGALFLGVVLTVLEARLSQRAIRFEVQRVLALPRS